MKPKCRLIGEDGNVFNIIARVKNALNNAGLKKEAKEFVEKVFNQKSYNDVLKLCNKYVDIY